MPTLGTRLTAPAVALLLCLGGCGLPADAPEGDARPATTGGERAPAPAGEPAAPPMSDPVVPTGDPSTADDVADDDGEQNSDGEVAATSPFVPARVVVEAIGVDEPLIDLGLADDGAMEVPVDAADAGWFAPGGRPGGPGPTVLAGHVDSPTGGGVFARLTELVPGDRVEVLGAAGERQEYVVTEVGDHPKDDFPTARVFGATGTDRLRLITCTGLWDAEAASYVDNRVVYAEPVEPAAPGGR